MPSRAVSPCAATWSPCPPASPRPPREPTLHLPRTGHGRSGQNPVGPHHRLQSGDPTSWMNATSPAYPPPQARPRRHVESWCRPADHSCPHHSQPPQSCRNQPRDATQSLIHGFRISRVAGAHRRRRVVPGAHQFGAGPAKRSVIWRCARAASTKRDRLYNSAITVSQTRRAGASKTTPTPTPTAAPCVLMRSRDWSANSRSSVSRHRHHPAVSPP